MHSQNPGRDERLASNLSSAFAIVPFRHRCIDPNDMTLGVLGSQPTSTGSWQGTKVGVAPSEEKPVKNSRSDGNALDYALVATAANGNLPIRHSRFSRFSSVDMQADQNKTRRGMQKKGQNGTSTSKQPAAGPARTFLPMASIENCSTSTCRLHKPDGTSPSPLSPSHYEREEHNIRKYF